MQFTSVTIHTDSTVLVKHLQHQRATTISLSHTIFEIRTIVATLVRVHRELVQQAHDFLSFLFFFAM